MRVFLETERLILRHFTDDDLELIVDVNSDPEVTWFITGGKPTPLEEVRDEVLPRWKSFYEQYEGFGYFAAIEKSTGEFLGWLIFRPNDKPVRADGSVREGIELGYRLRRSAWGKGYATEGSRALIRKGFTELGVDRVFAEALAVHGASRRVMEKAGLRYVGACRDDWPDHVPGDEHGDVEYALTKDEWAASAN
ncbi:GNAT family N-acetyltransferase [Cryptosporangium aurantiacum]|uniref:Protein N-acetyltransferase, RimJ/RimL family n=1 Tax=Cryptosporangium aurantiacum TaxID=134849 RepID=A0A1M7RDP3_9ACTN|nr:GNAT family N-acetyltransferase [Cryptosporangium aurantiacum]SHN44336.1 Protein N-acetyltransferase, RimJ/RimL family [Cryptosporangium aurantiacum]